MIHPHRSIRALPARALPATIVAFALLSSLAVAQSVSVTLNGSPLALSPGPEERAGRVFVPLRGVFEQLGASVVYADGTINAQGNHHAVSLHIGSTQATVDGQPQTLDVAPFITGASTYVPLRFVSQALGANVDYDAGNRIVALTSAPAGPPPQSYRPQPPPVEMAPAAPARSALALRDQQPRNDAAVDSRRPTIEAQFAGAQADPNSIRVLLDGVNVTDQTSRSANGIVFSPPSDLQSQRHVVQITGHDVDGLPFDRSWAFVSGNVVGTNFIHDVRPGENGAVGSSFTVSGRTMPNARVIVQVGTVNAPSAQSMIGQIIGIGNGSSSMRAEVTADGNGDFTTPVSLDVHGGQDLTLVVDSTDARTQSAAPRVVRDLHVQ